MPLNEIVRAIRRCSAPMSTGRRFGRALHPPSGPWSFASFARPPAMYFRVPVELQETFLREVRRLRLRSSVLRFPFLLLVFVAVAAGVVLLEGDAGLELLRRWF